MKIKDYLRKNKVSRRDFAKKIKISRYSLQRYIEGRQPAAKQAWKIYSESDGQIKFEDMQYEEPPKNPLKDI